MNAITLKGIKKSYTENGVQVPVLDDFSLDVFDHEILCLFGPNGCGKTTLVNICAGLIKADAGLITIFESSPKEVRIGYIPQAFSESLFPWLNNLDNVCLPLRLAGVSPVAARAQASQFLEKYEMMMPFSNYPYESSGGQKQLTALARALISSPSVLLADEPFSALDYLTRLETQDKFLEIVCDRLRLPTIFVSHQIEDAIYLGDQLVVLSERPARVVDILEINLPRPRTQEIKKTAEFAALRSRAIETFLHGVAYEA